MKRIICLILSVIFISMIFVGCSGDTHISTSTKDQAKKVNQSGKEYELSFIADFYDNAGEKWLTTEGSSFKISPNKVKEYYWNSDGSWVSGWTMSSIMSIDIDGNKIDTCGSTVIIYDNYLVKQDCVLPSNSTNTSNSDSSSISSPNDIQISDYWTVGWWWRTKDTRNYSIGEKIILVQSQEGNPICLFSGKNVSWEVSRNLPKTTEITIDGAKLYIHRANFSVIDKSIFD